MPAKTDFNVQPFYDDWSLTDDFYRVLFRPGYAIQARELTQLQTILQNQIEQFGDHIFKEGTIIIPGHVGYDAQFYAVKIQPTFSTGTVADYLSDYDGAIITGATSGVTAKVISYAVATTAGDPDTLFVKYIKTSSANNATISFSDNEYLGADKTISTYTYGNTTTLRTAATATDTTIYLTDAAAFPSAGSIKIGDEDITYTGKSTNDLTGCTRGTDDTAAAAHSILATVTNTLLTNSAQLLSASATAIGSQASVQEGIFFVRGFFVQTETQTLILDKYTNTPSYRVGFDVTETILTPETDAALLDNAQGQSNFAAPGADRFKMTLALAKKELTATDDSNFVELLRVENGVILNKVRSTEYSVVEKMIARRTSDESGNYIVDYFGVEPRENLDDGSNRGIYTAATGGLENKLTYVIGPGKAYVSGHEYEFLTTSFVNTNKARDTQSQNNDTIPFNLGNFSNVDKIYGMPDTTDGTAGLSDIVVFKEVQFYDIATGVRGTTTGGVHVGLARSRGFEYSSGTVGATSSNLASVYKHYLFDITMFTDLTISSATTLTAGAIITGGTSGATGIVFANVAAGTSITVMQTVGTFVTGETIGSSDSTDTPGSGTLSAVTSREFSKDVKQIYMLQTAGAGMDYTADTVLNSKFELTGQITCDVTKATTLNAGINDTATTITTPGSGTDGFPVPGVFVIGTELVSYTGTSATEFTGCVRGVHDTTAAAHSAAASITNLTVTGQNTFFNEEVAINDVLTFPSGAGGTDQEARVAVILSGTTLGLVNDPSPPLSSAVTSVSINRIRAQLQEQEETVLVYKLPKDDVSTLLDSITGTTDTTFTVRREFTGTTDGSSAVAFTVGSNQTFASYSNANYTLSILTAGSGSGVQGDIISIDGNVTGTGTQTITVTDVTNLGTSCKVKLNATVTLSVAGQKTKTVNYSTPVTIAYDATSGGGTQSDTYGERVGDKEISVGVADAFRLRAVYEAADITTVPVAPTLTISVATGTYAAGTTITGTSSGAKGVVISHSPSTTVSFVVASGTFTTLDQITGTNTAGTTVTATVGAVATGDTDITDSFTLDSGMRDSYYDISRLVRNPDALTPLGRILIIFDYFTHTGTGDYFSVDSYPVGTGATQIPYGDIPTYNATTVDPETLSPKGFYELRDSLDFRPRVANVAVTSGTAPFSFSTRAFEGTGSSTGDLVKPDDTIRMDYTFYLPRRDFIILTDEGVFQVIEGISAEQPAYPAMLNTTDMHLATVEMNAYTYSAEDMTLQHMDNRRYTMEDIGLLDRRISNLEYYTSLALLEKETQSFQLQDAAGLDRFKSGFIVDNFYGHNIGQNEAKDYQCSVDPALGNLRASSYNDNVALIEENTTDAQRTADGYQKTGDLITLPYIHEASVTQPLSSRVENVNPFNVASWVGTITLNPETDIWIDTKRVPALIVNVEGNYEQMMRTHKDALGTIWDSWETIWTGKAKTSWSGRLTYAGHARRAESGTESIDRRRKRTGVHTRLTERIDKISQGDRVINVEVIPWMREKLVQFVGKNFKPKTRLYVFFDKQNVNIFVKPTGTSAVSSTTTGTLTKTSTAIPVTLLDTFPTTGTVLIDTEQIIYTGKSAITGAGNLTGLTRAANSTLAAAHASGATVSGSVNTMPLITNALGEINGTFALPNTDTTRFRVGKRTFRMTDSVTNVMTAGIVESAGEAIYEARGNLETVREDILAVRNATVTKETVTEEATVTSTRAISRVFGWHDPLAQTFLTEQDNGEFITKVDVFFQTKDDTLPVTLQIRNVVNGYPGKIILPFSTVIKNAVDVTTTSDATTPTTFTFESPVYIKKNAEYAIVLLSNSNAFRVWISKMGEIDTGGTRAISSQPHLGSLFKSQNASTWTASQFEDLKFTLYRAKFDTAATGNFTLVNEELSSTSGHISTLDKHPLVTKIGTAAVKVKFTNHGMYSTNNSVIISGVKSEISDTTLNETLTDSDTTITITSATNFPTGGGSIKIDDEIITYAGISTNDLTGCTRGVGTTAATHENASIVELYMLAGIPLTEINKTFTAISGIEIDSFQITTTTSATKALTGGGTTVLCTRNVPMDVMYPLVTTMEVPGTTISSTVRTTTGKSLQGAETPFTKTSSTNAFNVPLNDNHYFTAPQIICSQINETNSTLVGTKSFSLNNTLGSSADNISPVIDMQRMGIITIANRLNEIASSSDLGSLTNFVASTEPTGDNNSAIYITKKVTLGQAATALQILFDAAVTDTAQMKVMYKILRTDSAENFQDIGWTYFNTSGISDTTVPISKSLDDFKEYRFSAGKKSTVTTSVPLDEFIAFAIKIVMQGTNSSYPPVIKDFRAIALAL